MPSAAMNLTIPFGGSRYPSVANWQYFCVSSDAVNDGSGKCSALTDRVNGYAFTQTTAGERYTIDTAFRSGKTLLYNAAGGTTRNTLTLANSTVANVVANGKPDYTVHWYGCKTDNTQIQYFWEHNDGSLTTLSNQQMCGLRTTAQGAQYVCFSQPFAKTVSVAIAGAFSNTLLQAHCYVYDGTANTTSWYVNNVFQASTAISPLSNSPNFTTVTLGSLSAATGSRNALKGYNAVWGLSLGKASSTERNNFYNWCLTRFGP